MVYPIFPGTQHCISPQLLTYSFPCHYYFKHNFNFVNNLVRIVYIVLNVLQISCILIVVVFICGQWQNK